MHNCDGVSETLMGHLEKFINGTSENIMGYKNIYWDIGKSLLDMNSLISTFHEDSSIQDLYEA